MDYSVACLVHLDPDGGEILLEYFLLGRPLARIAREAHLDRRTVRYRLDAAVAWVAGRLDREEY